jgi:putative aminopeptidase FrvX
MNHLAKNSLVQAAALTVVWAVACTFTTLTSAATAKVEARHPDLVVAQTFEVLEQSGQNLRHDIGAKKGDLLVQQNSCQTWPYVASECLTGTAAARKISRTITIEKRTGTDSSALIRVAAEPQVAAR